MEKFIDEYCLAKKGATKEVKEDWDGAILYKVGGKMFALVGIDARIGDHVSVKLEVEFSSFLRDTYQAVEPGYHMNKKHWSSLFFANNDVPENILKDMLDMSYELVFNSLTKKVRETI